MGGAQTVLEDESTPNGEYTLVVAISNPSQIKQLMRTATDVAIDRNGEIRVVTVVHKPATSPFLLFSEERIKAEFAEGRGTLLDRAVAIAEDDPVPVTRSLVVDSDVSDGILSVVEDTDADALLLGWQERPRPSDIVLGTTVDPLVRQAPCDVFIERVGTTANGMEAILLPTDGGPHIEPATDLAAAVARTNDATVRVVSYVSPTADDTAREAAREHVATATEGLADVSVTTNVTEEESVTDAIIAAGMEHDLTVLGATRERRVRQRVVGSVARAVGRHATVPVVIAKRQTEESLLDRAFNWW